MATMYYVANEHGVTNPFPAQLPEDLQRRAKERKYRPVDGKMYLF